MNYLYIGVALLFLLTVILILQVIYVRMSLSKYARDDYYKQSLVKDTYQQHHRICSNIGIYAWDMDIPLARNLNTTIMQSFAFPTFAMQHHYPLPNGSSIAYQSRDFIIIPLKSNNATSRFVNDIAGGQVDYVTWGSYLFRTAHLTQYVEKMTDFWNQQKRHDIVTAVKDREFIALYTIPTIEQLAKFEICTVDGDTTECKRQLDALRLSSNSPVIQGIMASSTPRTILDINLLPSMMHIIAYTL